MHDLSIQELMAPLKAFIPIYEDTTDKGARDKK